MNLKDFKLIKNKQCPDFCYSYENKINDYKYSIFTMDGGKTFMASIEKLNIDKRYYSEFSKSYNSVQECLDSFTNFNNNLL